MDREEDATDFTGADWDLLPEAGGRALLEGVLVAARLMAAIAAAEAAPVWFDTFAQALAGDNCLEEARFAGVHVWSLGKRCCGQNCCLQDWVQL